MFGRQLCTLLLVCFTVCSALDLCGTTVKSLACQIKGHSRIRLLDNNVDLNKKGNNDGADPKSNIEDTCDGKKALRSRYCCKLGRAPGGSVCLSANVLQYILDLANDGHSIRVNSLAGACHSKNSRHYLGTAVDLQVYPTSDYAAWMLKCSSAGAVENLGPGKEGHDGHTHCAFAN